MPAPRHHSVLVEAARLYYVEDRSQAEVARALGVSRSSVSRILAAARDQGVVEIRIHDPGVLDRVADVEARITEDFGVGWAMVVPRPKGRSSLEVVARASARVFEERLPGLASFGLSWGVTVQQFVACVDLEPVHSNLSMCPLSGGMPSAGPAGNVSLEVLAQRSGAVSHRFEAPAVVESPRTWAALTRESTIVDAIARAASVQLAFVGIGAYGVHNSRTVVSSMKLAAAEERHFHDQQPVGDICGRFYDLAGTTIEAPVSTRVIGITMQQLAHIPESVGIAAGVEKAAGVVGALRAHVLDGIVLDEDLAREALRLSAS